MTLELPATDLPRPADPDADPGIRPGNAWRARHRFGTRAVPTWLSLAALAVGGFAIGTTEFASMGVLPDVASGFGVSIPTAGWGITAYALGVVVGAPLIAVLAADVPRKRLMVGLAAALLVGNLASALAPTFGAFVAARFASGLPHGAYFGIGAVVASSLVPPHLRGRSVALMMTGLTVANVAGVPLSTLVGQVAGWRVTYLSVVLLALLTVLAVHVLVPPTATDGAAGPRRELSALGRPQVWLTLALGSVGYGGLFAVYAYISPTLTTVTGLPVAAVPAVLAVFGVGLTAGTLVGGRLADWSVDRTIALGLGAAAVSGLLFSLVAHAAVAAVVVVLMVAFFPAATMAALTLRLMDSARDGKALASSLNHSALNIANALGAWLGGLVIAAGLGYTAPAVVGAGLAGLGLLVLGLSRFVPGDRP